MVFAKLAPIIALYIYWMYKEPLSWLLTIGLICAGVVFWSFFEYAVHRWVYHIRFKNVRLRWFFDAFHFHHHSDLTDYRVLNAGVLLIYPLTGFVLLLVYLISGNLGTVAAFGIGASGYYFFYENVHYFIHFKEYKRGYMRFIQKYHLFHHYRRWNVNYGNTNTFWDHLFGTYDARYKDFDLSDSERKELITID